MFSKKMIFAPLMAGLISPNAIADITYDFFGEFGVGGEVKLEGKDKGRYADGTYLKLGLTVKDGPWFGLAYLELYPVTVDDNGNSWVYGHGWGGFEGGFNRFYGGYRFDSGVELTVGRMDSALDNHDYWGDYTVEYGATPTDVGDVAFAVKLRDNLGDFRYGISAAPKSNFDRDDALVNFGKYDYYADKFVNPAHINGYVDFDLADFKFFGGVEITGGEGELYILGTQFKETIGFRVWHDTEKSGDAGNGHENGFMVNAKYEPIHNVFLSAGYNHRDHEDDGKKQYVNAGVWYAYGVNNKYATAIDFYLPKDNESKFMIKQFFYF